MSANSPMLRLPPRRLDQLKALSAVLNLSLADTVGHLVRKEIAAGTIPDTIPGIVVKRAGDKVVITVDDRATASYGLETARKLAVTIRAVVDVAPGEMNVMLNFGVIRRGGGMKLFFPLGGPETILSPDLASDLANLIEKAAS